MMYPSPASSFVHAIFSTPGVKFCPRFYAGNLGKKANKRHIELFRSRREKKLTKIFLGVAFLINLMLSDRKSWLMDCDD